MVATNHRATPARAVVAGGIGVGKSDYFERTIELEGALDNEQRARLLKAAQSCPAGLSASVFGR